MIFHTIEHRKPGHEGLEAIYQQNLQQEEQTAQTAEQSAPQLLQKAM